MKHTKLIFIFILFSAFLSCEEYLEVQLDNQMTQEEVFSKRATTEAYLTQVYGFLPVEADWLNEGSAVPRSDEALFYWYSGIGYLEFNNGSWGPTTGTYNYWNKCYQGINQATIFMNHGTNVLPLMRKQGPS
ncbi:MAG: RagB/SusD family nutrient uptake outer membrane protein [Tannerella sp.]|jgi:hypothetical protein|nr:RagB/SusD family nutrient uptake outer membrane protein [Tannerella sp.]